MVRVSTTAAKKRSIALRKSGRRVSLNEVFKAFSLERPSSLYIQSVFNQDKPKTVPAIEANT